MLSLGGRLRSRRAALAAVTATGRRWKRPSSSVTHWSTRCGGHRTVSRSMSPRSSNSRAMRAASMVLPMPTSSAISSRTGSSFNAMSRGTSWYARGSIAIWPKLLKGPAPRRNDRTSASRSSRAASWPAFCVGCGQGKDASTTGSASSARWMNVWSSSEPETGRTRSTSASLPARTIHSRPRARTRLPGLHRPARSVADGGRTVLTWTTF